MNITVEALTTVGGLVAAVMVLMTILKPLFFGATSGDLQDKWTPAMAVLLGIVLALVANVALGTFGASNFVQAALNGFVAGATAVGIYTTGKNALLR